MADFKTHITFSSALGVAYGAVGTIWFGIPLQHGIVAGALCGVAGMLPDLDSDSGVPIRETLCFVSVVAPMLMLRRFEQMGMSPETMVLVSGLIYVAIRFGAGYIFKRYTTHRGMWHSIPAALIAGGVTYLLALSPELGIRLFKSWAVVLGFLSHLFLDEVYSVDLRGRRVKRSLGTAMKWYGDNRWANFATYAKLALVSLIILGDRPLMNLIEERTAPFRHAARQQLERSLPAPNALR